MSYKFRPYCYDAYKIIGLRQWRVFSQLTWLLRTIPFAHSGRSIDGDEEYVTGECSQWRQNLLPVTVLNFGSQIWTLYTIIDHMQLSLCIPETLLNTSRSFILIDAIGKISQPWRDESVLGYRYRSSYSLIRAGEQGLTVWLPCILKNWTRNTQTVDLEYFRWPQWAWREWWRRMALQAAPAEQTRWLARARRAPRTSSPSPPCRRPHRCLFWYHTVHPLHSPYTYYKQIQ